MRRLAVLIVFLGVALGIAYAQTGGTITGEVKDQSGALVPNVTVTATNTATNVARDTQTNTAGIYSFPGLIPGRYQVKAAAGGFQTSVTNDIELQVQQTSKSPTRSNLIKSPESKDRVTRMAPNSFARVDRLQSSLG